MKTKWQEIRIKVFERDNYTCRRCKIKDFIGVHHIIPYRISKNNNLSNLLTLCPRHHTTMENDYRRIGFTRFLQKLIEENARMQIKMLKMKMK